MIKPLLVLKFTGKPTASLLVWSTKYLFYNIDQMILSQKQVNFNKHCKEACVQEQCGLAYPSQTAVLFPPIFSSQPCQFKAMNSVCSSLPLFFSLQNLLSLSHEQFFFLSMPLFTYMQNFCTCSNLIINILLSWPKLLFIMGY